MHRKLLDNASRGFQRHFRLLERVQPYLYEKNLNKEVIKILRRKAIREEIETRKYEEALMMLYGDSALNVFGLEILLKNYGNSRLEEQLNILELI